MSFLNEIREITINSIQEIKDRKQKNTEIFLADCKDRILVKARQGENKISIECNEKMITNIDITQIESYFRNENFTVQRTQDYGDDFFIITIIW